MNARLTSSASGHPASRLMRTTCCFAECTPPARMRVLTGVRYVRDRDDEPAIDRAVEAREKAAALLVGADEPREARAAAERGDVVGGVAAPPATIVAASYLRISTGASRDTRDTWP